MTKVAIEQTAGGWQTYIRLSGVGRLLDNPYVRISRPGSSGSLGPDGWKNTQRVNEAAQYLDGNDLLLEITPSLINYLEPGQAIEIHIAELNLTERILAPALLSAASSTAVEPESVQVFRFRRGRPPPDPPPQPEGRVRPATYDPSVATGAADVPQDGHHDSEANLEGDDGRNEARYGHDADYRQEEPDSGDRHRPHLAEDHPADPEPEAHDPFSHRGRSGSDDSKSSDQPSLPAHSLRRRSRARAWLATGITLLIGVSIGAAGKHVADIWIRDNTPALSSGPSSDAAGQQERAQLQTEAFAPLNADVGLLGAASPGNVSPDTVADRLNVDRARAFYGQGSRDALAGKKQESVYWYKQSVRACPADALFYLGDAYFSGDGMPSPDRRTGFQLMRCSAALGSPKAKEYLPTLLRSGNLPLAPREQRDPY